MGRIRKIFCFFVCLTACICCAVEAGAEPAEVSAEGKTEQNHQIGKGTKDAPGLIKKEQCPWFPLQFSLNFYSDEHTAGKSAQQ